ncbi:TetR/AcrR family transcriptional regulator [Amycolatopsis sp. GM8]|uniref:TetR/AcrR family transcriptional regulator n=1 Tax=Amycolatopsis sp. GM8 TaxID=2896530 RepID=UPI001F426BE9|nr:TetR/AcrR family transcriptional regulator [Amycolatopsis sp. GM8]
MTAAAPRRATRKDARRNYDQIVAAAADAIAVHGADASLEEIARQAGVGSATLYRHFATRYELLEAVFHGRVVRLVEESRELADNVDPASALFAWLRSVGAYVAATRGLAESLMLGRQQRPPFDAASCYDILAERGAELVDRAHAAGVIRPEVTIVDLMMFLYALSLAVEQGTDGSDIVDRLLLLASNGIFEPDTLPATKPVRRKKAARKPAAKNAAG